MGVRGSSPLSSTLLTWDYDAESWSRSRFSGRRARCVPDRRDHTIHVGVSHGDRAVAGAEAIPIVIIEFDPEVVWIGHAAGASEDRSRSAARVSEREDSK